MGKYLKILIIKQLKIFKSKKFRHYIFNRIHSIIRKINNYKFFSFTKLIYDIYFIKQLKIASFFFEVLEKSTSKNAVLTLLLN